MTIPAQTDFETDAKVPAGNPDMALVEAQPYPSAPVLAEIVSSKPPPVETVEIIAPSDLRGGYELYVDAGNNQSLKVRVVSHDFCLSFHVAHESFLFDIAGRWRSRRPAFPCHRRRASPPWKS